MLMSLGSAVRIDNDPQWHIHLQLMIHKCKGYIQMVKSAELNEGHAGEILLFGGEKEIVRTNGNMYI